MSTKPLLLALLAACSINGHAVGPHLGAAAPAAKPAASSPAAPASPGTTAAPSTADDPAAAPDDTPPRVTVPDLNGLTVDEANARLRAAGLTRPVDTEQYGAVMSCGPDARDGRVCGQHPAPGTVQFADEPVEVRLGHYDARADKVVVPDVRGMHLADARAAFARAGFMAEPLLESGAGCKPDIVCSQTPEGGRTATRGERFAFFVGP
jgi:hypothetical protein